MCHLNLLGDVCTRGFGIESRNIRVEMEIVLESSMVGINVTMTVVN